MSAAPSTLVVATGNRGKIRELISLLGDLPLNVVSVADVLGQKPAVAEDEDTFAQNACKKAVAIGSAVGMLTLADDSGLEVDALGGRPGVRSARFAGENASDEQNNAALLAALAGFSGDKRRARYRCALALFDPRRDGVPIIVEGVCEGFIAHAPRGNGGFGYDPLFFMEGEGKTMAELDLAQKNRISHRAHAVTALRPRLELLLGATLLPS